MEKLKFFFEAFSILNYIPIRSRCEERIFMCLKVILLSLIFTKIIPATFKENGSYKTTKTQETTNEIRIKRIGKSQRNTISEAKRTDRKK